MRYLGIDGGTKGYLCLLQSDDRIEVAPMPRQSVKLVRKAPTKTPKKPKLGKNGKPIKSKSSDYDVGHMMELMRYAVERSDEPLVVVMEAPQEFMRPGGRFSTAKTIISLQRCLAYWSMTCSLHGVPLYTIAASSWKAYHGILKTPKDYTLEHAAKLRPNCTFPAVDAADAFLIAMAGRGIGLGYE